MTAQDEPTFTVVETDTASAVVIVTHSTLPHHGQVGIVTFCIGLEAGLRIAYEQVLVWEVTGSITTMSLETVADSDKPRRSSIALSDKAWSTLSKKRDECGYFGTAKNTGLFAFLAALIQHNPTPETMWTDTRSQHPEQLQMFDFERLSNGQLPLWSQAPDVQTRIRKPRGIIAEHWTPLIPAYAALGRHYGISPYRGGSFENPSVVASATLEAIGLDYLTPAMWPHNAEPRTRVTDRSAASMRSREARKVYERFDF